MAKKFIKDTDKKTHYKANSNGISKEPGPLGDLSNFQNPSKGKKDIGKLDTKPAKGKKDIGKLDTKPAAGKKDIGKLDTPAAPGKKGIGDLKTLAAPGKNKIGDLDTTPAPGKKGIADLTHLQNPAPGKYQIKQNNNAASNGVNKGPGAIKAYSDQPSHYDEWPLAKYSFEVEIGGFGGSASFQTMDGLGASVGKMEFRDGNSNKFYKQHRPTLTAWDPCTLKKGVFVGDTALYDWFNNVSTGSMFSDMRTVSIHLCEHGGNQDLTRLFTWTLEKAYVTKYTPSGLDGEADTDIAVEEIEISYQSFTLTAGAGGLLGSLLGAVTGALPGGNLIGSLTGAVSGSISL